MSSYSVLVCCEGYLFFLLRHCIICISVDMHSTLSKGKTDRTCCGRWGLGWGIGVGGEGGGHGTDHRYRQVKGNQTNPLTPLLTPVRLLCGRMAVDASFQKFYRANYKLLTKKEGATIGLLFFYNYHHQGFPQKTC